MTEPRQHYADNTSRLVNQACTHWLRDRRNYAHTAACAVPAGRRSDPLTRHLGHPDQLGAGSNNLNLASTETT
jgi:hypothetical protein